MQRVRRTTKRSKRSWRCRSSNRSRWSTKNGLTRATSALRRKSHAFAAPGANALIVGTAGSPAGVAFHGITDVGLDIPVITGNGNASQAFMKQYAAILPKELYVESTHCLAPGAITDKAEKAAYDTYAAAIAAHGVPLDCQQTLSWDPALILTTALKHTGTDVTADQLRAYISNMRGVAGVNGTYNFKRVPATRSRRQCRRHRSLERRQRHLDTRQQARRPAALTHVRRWSVNGVIIAVEHVAAHRATLSRPCRTARRRVPAAALHFVLDGHERADDASQPLYAAPPGDRRRGGAIPQHVRDRRLGMAGVARVLRFEGVPFGIQFRSLCRSEHRFDLRVCRAHVVALGLPVGQRFWPFARASDMIVRM